VTIEIAVAAAWGLIVAGGGAFLTNLTPWYRALRKPPWQPPDWLFGPAWTVILGLASVSAYLAWQSAPDPGSRFLVVVLFLANGVANLAWSPLLFRLRRPDWALWEVPLLWLSILVPVILLAPISAWASVLLLPYLAWVLFAAFLNLTIVRLNGPFGGATDRA
jgi:benzodiazapine receptor